jgi:hypothetical protein
MNDDDDDDDAAAASAVGCEARRQQPAGRIRRQ